MLVMGPWETGMWKRDSDGGELPEGASGSCHIGLINAVTRQEARPVTSRAFQQVMKAGRMASGWQEPGAVRRANARTRCHVHHVDQAPPSLIFLDWDSCEYGLCNGADGWVCILHLEDEESACACKCVCVSGKIEEMLAKSSWSKTFSHIKIHFMSPEFSNLSARQLHGCSTKTVKPKSYLKSSVYFIICRWQCLRKQLFFSRQFWWLTLT